MNEHINLLKFAISCDVAEIKFSIEKKIYEYIFPSLNWSAETLYRSSKFPTYSFPIAKKEDYVKNRCSIFCGVSIHKRFLAKQRGGGEIKLNVLKGVVSDFSCKILAVEYILGCRCRAGLPSRKSSEIICSCIS